MSDVIIKNITVSVDGQEHSFSGRTVTEDKPYDPATDPEVQGKSLEDVQPEVEPVVEPTEPEVPTEESQVEAPTATTTE